MYCWYPPLPNLSCLQFKSTFILCVGEELPFCVEEELPSPRVGVKGDCLQWTCGGTGYRDSGGTRYMRRREGEGRTVGAAIAGGGGVMAERLRLARED